MVRIPLKIGLLAFIVILCYAILIAKVENIETRIDSVDEALRNITEGKKKKDIFFP